MTPKTIFTKTTVREAAICCVTRSQKTNVEYGFAVAKQPLERTPIQKGDNNGLTIHYGRTPLMSAHTHPDEQYETLFSATDIRSLLNSPIQYGAILYDKNGRGYADIFQAQDAQLPNQPNLQQIRHHSNKLRYDTVDLGEIPPR
jgi:hypothetical protein